MDGYNSTTMNHSGYIYFASNPSMPGLLKIGSTGAFPSARLPQLQSTGVPTPFVLQICVLVADRVQAEKRIHELLAESRQSHDREFFRVSVSEVLGKCASHFATMVMSATNHSTQPSSCNLPCDEQAVLLYVAQQARLSKNPRKSDTVKELGLSPMQSELVLGNLLKKRFLREIDEIGRSQIGPAAFESYKTGRKLLKPMRAGLQYLVDSGLLDYKEI